MQHLLIIFLFILALGYLARLIYQHFQADKGCTKGCGSCSTIDLEKIQKQISEKA
ncbi:MAG: FeoB-associated Cys-rich membrane protein [Bacteroidota bacterium]